MAFVLKDRVRETTDTNGTGAIRVTGVVSGGYQTFTSVLSNGDTTLCLVRNAAGQWQTFLGTWNSAAQTMARTTAYEGSSGAGVNVNFSGESQEIWIDYPAQWYHTPRFETVTVGDNLANYWSGAGAAASGYPAITAAGSDAHITMRVNGKGNGWLWTTRMHIASASSPPGTSDTYREFTVGAPAVALTTSSVLARIGGNFFGTNLGAAFSGAALTVAADADTVTFSDTSTGYTLAYNGQTVTAGWSGGRTLAFDFLNITGAGTSGSSAFHVAGGGEVRAQAWMGGTPGAERGSPFARNELARVYGTSGPHMRQVFGDEFDIEVRDGAAVLWKGGAKAVLFATDVRRGLQQDFAFSAGMQGNIPDGFTVNRAPGFSIVYAINGKEGWPATTETSSVMRAITGGIVNGPEVAAAFGADFSNFTRFRVAPFKAKDYQVDGSGNLGALVASGVTVQTNGSIVARTAVVGGIEAVDTGLYGGTVTITVPGGATASPAAYGIAASFSMTTGGSLFAADDTFEVEGGTTTTAATGTGEIAGTTLTITAASSGLFGVGQLISSMTGVTSGTRITALGTGTGGTGTYTVDPSQTVASTAITTTGPAVFAGTIADNVLTVSAMTSGILTNNPFLIHDELTDRTRIIAFGTGAGGTGTYTIDTSQVRGTSMTGIRAGGPAEGVVSRISGSAVSGFRMTNPGYYTVLPSYPVATRATIGTGTGLTFNPAVNILAVTVTGAGSGYGEFNPPVPVASGTLGDYRHATFKVSMTGSAGTLALNSGVFSVTGIPTSSAGLPAGRVWSDGGTLKVV